VHDDLHAGAFEHRTKQVGGRRRALEPERIALKPEAGRVDAAGRMAPSSSPRDTSLQVRRGASRAPDAAAAVRELRDAVAQDDTRLVLFYCAPDYDRGALASALQRELPGRTVIGCTTAGEIGPLGYLDGSLSGVSLAGDIRVAAARIDELRSFTAEDAALTIQRLRNRIESDGAPVDGSNTFAFLVIDGLSGLEEVVVSQLYRNLGDVQLFGGSAGDGTRFGATFIYHDGSFHQDCAVLVLMQTSQPFRVFKTQHFVRADDKLVVTGADPARRLVTEINGEPAGREYARIMGLDVVDLTPLIFACHPVVVRMAGEEYVRSIQKVNDDGSLTFFCAIDEGVVLTVARGVDLIDGLERQFRELEAELGPPQLVLGCDCILRHLECKQRGITDRVGEIFAANNVVGFGTYGEQYNAVHVNQTFTGVAIGRRR
jgi:hypothetical protein